jgi:hypothetical protein
MKDSFVPLVIATAAFLVVLLWRVRPLGPWSNKRRASRQALREAQARIEAAQNDAERARALCDAADLLAAQVRGRASARGLYLRAMRLDTRSVEVIERAAACLWKHPKALEALLWRRLAAEPWSGSREATVAILDALRTLYEGPLRNAIRARALQNAREALLK